MLPQILLAAAMMPVAYAHGRWNISKPEVRSIAVPSKVTIAFREFLAGNEMGIENGGLVNIRDTLTSGLFRYAPREQVTLPAYANWTGGGWNIRLDGQVFKTPNLTDSEVYDIMENLPIEWTPELLEKQRWRGINMTRLFLAKPRFNDVVQVHITNNSRVEPMENGGAIPGRGSIHDFIVPQMTDIHGAYSVFGLMPETWSVRTENNRLLWPRTIAGDVAKEVQVVNMKGSHFKRQQTQEVSAGENAGPTVPVVLVPLEGYTIVSSIDDIMLDAGFYEPVSAITKMFTKPFKPWMNMVDVFKLWATSRNHLHFHYMTESPQALARPYVDFIKHFPVGSLDVYPLDLSQPPPDIYALHRQYARGFQLERVAESFSKRRIILIGDGSSEVTVKSFADVWHKHPISVQCIFLRNTTATVPDKNLTVDLSPFVDVPPDRYFVFNVPDDLIGMEFINGGCLNRTLA